MKLSHDDVRVPEIPEARIAILQSKWYREYTDKMIEKCLQILAPSKCKQPAIYVLPGALEMPLAAQALARARTKSSDLEAIICFGAIMKGETFHFEMIMNECVRGLGQVMLNESIPILIEVLPVSTIDQVAARSADDGFNKGIEAALAAAEIIYWRRQLRKLMAASEG